MSAFVLFITMSIISFSVFLMEKLVAVSRMVLFIRELNENTSVHAQQDI